jgi:flagellar motor switch/type III secretory pathway protein FliN
MSSSPTSSSSSDAASRDAAFPLAPLADVACPVDFLVGTANVTVGQCLGFATDSVIRLAQPSGSEFAIRINGVVIAHGEVAVVDDSAALRVTRLAMPAGVGWE